MKERNNRNSSQKVKYSFIKILTGSDLSRRRLPFMSIESRNGGPNVWLTACGHGDEVGGMVVIQEIFKILRKKPLLKGSVYAFPLMNPIGFETASRNITLSKEDLNRSFPGNKNGSLAERIAEQIFSTILDTNPALVLDLHNDWMKSIPYTVVDVLQSGKNQNACDYARAFAHITGFLTIQETDNLKKTLSYTLLQNNIPALTVELGESFVVNEENVNYGVKSILNIFSELGMIAPVSENFVHKSREGFENNILEFSNEPVSTSSGIIRFMANPGSTMRKEQPLAKIYNPFGKLQETLQSLHNGVILGYSDSSVAFPGAPVMAFGITED